MLRIFTKAGPLLLLVISLTPLTPAQASPAPPPITFTATLGADQLTTPVDSGGSGEARALLIGNELVVTGTYRDLSSPLNASTSTSGANVRMAPAGEAGAVVRLSAEQPTLVTPKVMRLTADGGTSGWFTGAFTLTEEQVEALKQGLFYVQLYTEENATGELRGQLGTDRVLDATAEDLVGIWREVDGRIFQNFPDGTWIRVGRPPGAGNTWAFADDRFTIAWTEGSQVAYEELYRDGRRRHWVLEASGAYTNPVGSWRDFVKVDEEGNRVNLRE